MTALLNHSRQISHKQRKLFLKTVAFDATEVSGVCAVLCTEVVFGHLICRNVAAYLMNMLYKWHNASVEGFRGGWSQGCHRYRDRLPCKLTFTPMGNRESLINLHATARPRTVGGRQITNGPRKTMQTPRRKADVCIRTLILPAKHRT